MITENFDPRALLLCGDWHGDFRFACFCMERAINQDVQAIVQLGDFGFWEHAQDGVDFLDGLSHIAIENEMPIFWIDGNHENHTLLRSEYGPGGPKHKLVNDVFWEIRPGVYYMPRGARWTWSSVRFLALGGAYSVDKGWRIEREGELAEKAALKNSYRVAAGKPTKPWPEHTLWWPEEEITDEEVARIVADTSTVDIMFTHDKPLSSAPRWNRKDFPECYPNQQRIQEVMRVVQPKMLFHGHLHHAYEDTVRVGDDDKWCIVHALNCNTEAQNPRVGGNEAWVRLSLEREQ